MGSIRQQISVDASSRAVWDLLTTVEGVTSWWVEDARLDARDGGRIVVGRTVKGEEDQDVRQEDRGSFHQVRPTRAIEIAWDNSGNGPLAGTRLEFQVGRGDGETKVHVVQSGAGLDDDARRQEAEGLWKAALLKLRSKLES